MRDISTIPDTPPPELRYKHKAGVFKSAISLWRDREIVRSLADRDFRARYKQAFLGFAWAVINPLILVAVFTFTIRRFADVHTQGVPYSVWAYTGLAAWTFFSGAVTWATQCLVGNQALLNKVNFPREAFPVASVALACIDTSISLLGLIGYFAIFHFAPRSTSYWIPVIFLVQLAFTIGVSLVLSIVVVYIRDLRQIVPIIIMIGIFASPVAYNITQLLKPPWRVIYCTINPMAPVIDSYRRVILYGQMPHWEYLVPGAAMSLVFLFGGLRIFKRLETGIADLI
jgi:ABC-2 type transport system permease protein/lipopolysaccharide transport system permease protein